MTFEARARLTRSGRSHRLCASCGRASQNKRLPGSPRRKVSSQFLGSTPSMVFAALYWLLNKHAWHRPYLNMARAGLVRKLVVWTAEASTPKARSGMSRRPRSNGRGLVRRAHPLLKEMAVAAVRPAPCSRNGPLGHQASRAAAACWSRIRHQR